MPGPLDPTAQFNQRIQIPAPPPAVQAQIPQVGVPPIKGPSSLPNLPIPQIGPPAQDALGQLGIGAYSPNPYTGMTQGQTWLTNLYPYIASLMGGSTTKAKPQTAAGLTPGSSDRTGGNYPGNQPAVNGLVVNTQHSPLAGLKTDATTNVLDTGTTKGTQRTAQVDAVNTTHAQLPDDPAAVAGYKSMAAASATKYEIDPHIYANLVNEESGWDPNAVGAAGEEGITQVMPQYHPNAHPWDVAQVLDYSAQLISGYYQKYGSYALAVAAYNAGGGAVDAYLAGQKDLPASTRKYVNDIVGSRV